MKLAMPTLIVMIICCFMFGCAYSENHTVGGAEGWDLAADIKGWAARKTFYTGDNLIFSYAPIHDVREVTETSFELCRSSNPLSFFSGGLTVVPLNSPGTRYFICGTLGHCSLGLGVKIHVLPTGTTAVPNPAPMDDDGDEEGDGDGDGDSDDDALTARPSASPEPSPSGAMQKRRPPLSSNTWAPPPPQLRSQPPPGVPCGKGRFCPTVTFSPPDSTAPSAHASSGTTMVQLSLLLVACSIWLWLLVTGLSEYRE